jgi:heme/copper-type cytochrome/quinol oxidase subunit 4
MNRTERQSGELRADLVVYVCLLAIAGLQAALAYSGASFVPMLVLAIVQTLLIVMFLMHLRTERHSLILFVAVFTLFVLATINYGWTDSFRLLHGVPFAK